MDETGTNRGVAKVRIRDAALELFSANGFLGTSVRDVMNACHLTPGALYAHYESKESLLFDLLYEGHQDLEAVLQQTIETDDDELAARLARLIYELVRYQLSHLDRARVARENIDNLPQDMRGQIGAIRAHINDFFADVYAAGVDRGVFDPADPQITVLAMLNSASQLTEWFRPSGRLTIPDVARRHAVMALRTAMCFDGRAVDTDGLVDAAIDRA